MQTTKPQHPPKVSLQYIIKSMQDIFGTLCSSPQRFPDALSTRILTRRVYVINNPEMAQHVLQKNYRNYTKGLGYEVLALLLGKGLINNEGDDWHKQRTLIQPAFHRETLKKISQIVTSSTNQLLQRWQQRQGQTINFTREMAEVTIDIVAKSMFTTDITPQNIQTVWRNVNYLNESADRMLRNPFSMPIWVPTPANVKTRKYISELDDIVYTIIRRRKQEQNPPHDLLQLLLDARYEDTGTGMTDLQIRDELMTIFLAGHETTVNALSWTWFLLKQHPAEEEKLHAESKRYTTADPAFEDVPTLAYGRHVMNESMRLYPPVPVIARNARGADMVGPYTVPAGVEVAINIAGLHHHPKYWPEPFAFKPQRFETFDLKGDNRFLFMPFGGGPRICIGNNFAMMEMQIINAMLSARVQMELVSQTVKPIALVTLKPGSGVIMKIKKVHPAA